MVNDIRNHAHEHAGLRFSEGCAESFFQINRANQIGFCPVDY